MTTFTALVGLLGVALLAACTPGRQQPAADRLITFNDFESAAGWNVDPGQLDKGRAHSGQYALKVDQGHEFSLTFDMLLGQASREKFKTLHLEAWAYLPGAGATGVLGVQVMKAGTLDQLYGDGIKLQEAVPTYRQWMPISRDFVLPDNITPDQHLRVSLWRADATDFVLVDDVQLSIKD